MNKQSTRSNYIHTYSSIHTAHTFNFTLQIKKGKKKPVNLVRKKKKLKKGTDSSSFSIMEESASKIEIAQMTDVQSKLGTYGVWVGDPIRSDVCQLQQLPSD